MAFGHRRSEGGRSGAAMQDGQSTQEKKVVRKTKEDIQKEIMQNVDPSLRAFLESALNPYTWLPQIKKLI